jgi:hypothetical protein
MERRVYSIPIALREQYVALDGFESKLKSWGWTLADHRPIYTDPQVIRQQWLLTASGTMYTDRAFYHLFGETRFRALLRNGLRAEMLTEETLQSLCPDEEQRIRYIAFLRDQEMLLFGKHGYRCGPALAGIQDIGHTLEWWVAEWLRRFHNRFDLFHVPVRHGVSLAEMIAAGDAGDLDVVALLPYGTIMVECKSSLLQIDPPTLSNFFWRSAFFEANASLLLVETPLPETSREFRSASNRLQRLDFIKQERSAGVHYWIRIGPIHTTGPRGQTIYWDTGTLYAALVGCGNNLEQTLEAVLLDIQRGQQWTAPSEITY